MSRRTRPVQYLDAQNNVLHHTASQDAIRVAYEGDANVRYYATSRQNESRRGNADFEANDEWRIYRLTYSDGKLVRKDFYLGNNDWIAVWDNGAFLSITSVTVANPGVMVLGSATWSDGTALANGDKIEVLTAAGMTELNSNTFYVSGLSTATFNLHQGNGLNADASTNEDTSGYGAYTGSGIAYKRSYLNHVYN